MTNSDLFKQAHALTKATIKAGDNYQATFGQCLKIIKAEQAKSLSLSVKVARKMASIDVEKICDYMTGFVLCSIIAFMLVLLFFVVALHSVPMAVVYVCSIAGVIVWAIWEQVKHKRELKRSVEIMRKR